MNMEKDSYHHGMLKEALIAKGLQLLNKDGYEGFSLRKVAALCGVSHAAPYRHFKDKDELVSAITNQVMENFKLYLEEAVIRYPDDPKAQIVNLGKQYVKFMVENPEYLKFFIVNHQFGNPVVIENNAIHHQANGVFEVFTQSAANYLNSLQAKAGDRIVDVLTMWSTVQGIAVLMVYGNLIYSGNYLDLVEKILSEKLKFE